MSRPRTSAHPIRASRKLEILTVSQRFPEARLGRASFAITGSFLLRSGLVLACACGGAAVTAPPVVGAPESQEDRLQAIDAAGERIYSALRQASPRDLLVDDLTLRAALEPDAASRVAATRASLGARVTSDREYYRTFENTSYAGACVQNARNEPVGSGIGLRAETWVFDRVLVQGTRPEGGRVAAWVEGTFVFTPQGFLALDLARVERPRWEHSDLDLAPCDLSSAVEHPRPVVGVTP